MRTTKERYNPVEVKPVSGGNLVTKGSSDNAGLLNYTVKRDVRRDLDVEIRREGHDYFYPNVSLPIGGQPFPGQITLDSLVYSAGYVTATRISGQWFEDGETIFITGATDPIMNGTFTISDATKTTFRYPVVGVPALNTSTDIQAAPDEKISLLAMARRPNGQVATIAGSKRRLYRYYALEDGDYISDDAADYPTGTATDELSYWSDGTLFPADSVYYPVGTPVSQQQYVDTNPGYWIVIGSGYSTDGNRWEVVSINGWMVFNNGVDLPCTYRVEDMDVIPIYELRDQGVAAVGTISETNSVLMLGDISEIQADHLSEWFNSAGWVQVDEIARTGSTVTVTIVAGHSFNVNDSITIRGSVYDAYNSSFYITAVTATTFDFEITGTPATPDNGISIYTALTKNLGPYERYTGGFIDRTIFRVLWGIPEFPRRFAPIYRGAINAGSNVLTLGHAILGLSVGQNITITGAGQSHAGGTADNLTGNIIYMDGPSIVLDSFALTTVLVATVTATDSIGTITGYEDLQDDGSGILKMLPLSDQIIIYKDSSIFIGQYLGSVDQPFAFLPRRVQKEQCLFYRNTLSLVETPTEMFHIYAGRNAFYRFDLANQQPMVLPRFENCSNIFFTQATLENTEEIFVCENGITHELIWAFPSSTQDKALCWDYKWDTHSTTSVELSSAATVRKPLAGLAHGAEEDWFIMGTAHGAVLIYGLTNINQDMPGWGGGRQIIYRRGESPYDATRAEYNSTKKTGLAGFGFDYGEKDLRAIVILMASQSPGSTEIVANLYCAQNANGPVTLLGSKTFSEIDTRNLLPIAARRFYFQLELVISGKDNPCRMVGEIWDVALVDSRSMSRG